MTNHEQIISNIKRIDEILDILMTQDSKPMRLKLIQEQAELGDANSMLYLKLSESEKDILEIELIKLYPTKKEENEDTIDNFTRCPGVIY